MTAYNILTTSVLQVPDQSGKTWEILINEEDYHLTAGYEWTIDKTTAEIEVFGANKAKGKNAGAAPHIVSWTDRKLLLHRVIFKAFCDSTGFQFKKHSKVVLANSWNDMRRNNLIVRSAGKDIAHLWAEANAAEKVSVATTNSGPNPFQEKVIEHYAYRITVAYESEDYELCKELTSSAEEVHPDYIYTLLGQNLDW